MRQYEPPGGLNADASASLDDAGPEEIKVEIEQTRTEMTGTIDAIQRKLAPDVLTEQAKDMARDATDHAKTAAQELLQNAVQEVKDAAIQVTEHAVHEVKDAAREVTGVAKDAAWDATVGRAEDAVSTAGETARGVGATVIETIKQHPIPAALAGISLYWLFKNRSGGPASAGTNTNVTGYRPSGGYGASPAPQAYPIRTGYASQAERDAMTARGGAATPHTYPGTVPTTSATGLAGSDESGIISSAGQMASDVVSAAGHAASDTMSSAGHMASSAGETARDAGSSVVDLIQQNPIPAALVGVGLGWLYLNRSSDQSSYRAPSGHQFSASGSYGAGATGSTVSDMARRASERASAMAGTVQDQAGDLASSLQDRVSDMADTVQEHVGDFAGAVKDRTVRAPGQLQRMMEENPLLTAALAVSLGGVVGLALPSTHAEDQLLGSTRDQVMGRASQMTSDAMDKVQNVAQEVHTTVTQEARTQGLTV